MGKVLTLLHPSPLQEYSNRPPKPCRYVFLIDVSYAAVQSGMLTYVVRLCLSCLWLLFCAPLLNALAWPM